MYLHTAVIMYEQSQKRQTEMLHKVPHCTGYISANIYIPGLISCAKVTGRLELLEFNVCTVLQNPQFKDM